MTSYQEIFDRALQKINDPTLAQWEEEDLSNELYGWLESSIASLPTLKSELSDRSDFDVYDLESTGFTNTLSDLAKEVLSLSMARAWLRPMINSTSNTLQMFSKKEGYSQKEHLSGLIALDKMLNEEIKKLIRDNTYFDSEYFG